MVKYERIDVYWSKVGKMTRPTGERKYPALMKLAIIALTLNHGNADVERRFSKNKLLLTSHRTRLDMPAINDLRTVSSYVSKYRSEPHRLPFSKDVANNIRSFHASYEERKKEREVMKKGDRRKTEAKVNLKKEKWMICSRRKKAQRLCCKKECPRWMRP